MAFIRLPTTCFFVFLLLAFINHSESFTCSFDEIFQFGDSISDTGNFIREESGDRTPYARLPYGETTFFKPTGRCSNGLLIIDYIVKAFKLPLLNPYLQKNASFDHGVNFAVAGSTAQDNEFFRSRNVRTPPANIPLSTQLKWFKNHFKSTCHTKMECESRLKRVLIMMGEIGGNDYNYGFTQHKSIEELRTWVPHVVGAIVNITREVIQLGATHIVVPGNFPIGCFPVYLTYFSSRFPWSYDDKGCLKEFNQFSMYHNHYLQKALASLRKEFSKVVIIYGDYYSAFQSVLRNPHFKYDPWTLLRACCGEGGLHNFNGTRMCGSPGVPVCVNPSNHISWDGIHLTQEAYLRMSEFLIPSIFSKIQCVW